MTLRRRVLPMDVAATIILERTRKRTRLMSNVRRTLKRWRLQAEGLHPFENGVFWEQVKSVVNQLARDETSRKNSRGKSSVHPAVRYKVFRRDGFRCVQCGWEPDSEEAALKRIPGKYGRILTVDHIIPHCEGGANIMDNLQSLCDLHNKRKGMKLEVGSLTGASP